MSSYNKMSASEIARTVRSGTVSAVEMTEQALELARTEDRRLNAFITVCDEKALGQARKIDDAVRRKNSDHLPLAGVPVALKDNICYSDYPCTCASHILEGFRPPYDATVVTRLIDAGAVIVGKTNMDEFAMGSSNENSFYGPVKNPIGDNLVPGGSSGGSAAVVAAGIVPLAFGSDTGGSIRQPASFCGVYGLKPTYGGVSRYGLVAFGSSLDQIGPFARCAHDTALAYKVISGRDVHDSTSAAFEHPDYPSLMAADRKFRFGLPKEYFAEGLDDEVNANVQNVIKLLEKRGHTFVDISLPLTDKAIAMYYILASAEASSNLARYDGVKYGRREADEKELAEMYSQTRAEGFGDEVKRRIMLGTYVLSSGYYDDYYLKAAKVRELMRRDFESNFEKIDLILAPTTPTAAFRFGEKLADPLAMYLSDVYTVSANLAGLPAISIPFGKTADGRPTAVQFVAAAFREQSLFQAAGIVESFTSSH